MKNIIVLLTVFISLASAAQTSRTSMLQRSDSVSAARAVEGTAAFQLSDVNKAKLAAAAKEANQIRRDAFNKYWKTASFQKEYDKAGYYQDSVYLSVLGKDKFMQYKTNEMYKRDRFESEQRARYQQRKDSATTKTRSHEN